MWKSNYRSDFLLQDRQHMEEYLQAGRCLRAFLSVYLDDENVLSFGVACKGFHQAEVCSVYAAVHTDDCIHMEFDVPDNSLSGSSPLSPAPDLHVSGISAPTTTS